MSSQYSKPRRTSTVLDPLAHPGVYYGESHSRKHARARTYSAVSPFQRENCVTGLTVRRM